MLTLWCRNPPADASTSQPQPANSIRLAYFLRKSNDIEESYPFLLQLLWSFWHAVASIDKERSGLDDYFENMVLEKSHEDVEQVSDAVLDELSDKRSATAPWPECCCITTPLSGSSTTAPPGRSTTLCAPEAHRIPLQEGPPLTALLRCGLPMAGWWPGCVLRVVCRVAQGG